MLTLELADALAELPLHSIQREYPNVLGHVMMGPEDVQSPKELHPAFYGCFDWHSSVHGHWMLVRLLKRFPLTKASEIRAKLSENLSKSNLEVEAAYLSSPNRRSFERMYGWAWLLKLAEEIRGWDDSLAMHLAPLEAAVVKRYFEFLPVQTYPIRVGTHTNTAFGLSFGWDYAVATGHEALKDLIRTRAMDYYGGDAANPAQLEPGGADFFSPALIEADLMRRLMCAEAFAAWFDRFLPDLGELSNLLEPAIVADRSDPQIAHLDGLNLSRAWCMKGIARALPDGRAKSLLLDSAKRHETAGLAHVASGHYEGEHWLASFAIAMLEA